MKSTSRRLLAVVSGVAFSALFLLSPNLLGQSCQTSSDMDDATRNAITAAGQKYFQMAAKQDVASLRQNAIPSLAADFTGVEGVVKAHAEDLSGAQATVKSQFVLNAEDAPPNQRDEFYCGVFGKNGQTANSAAFYLSNLAPAKYAAVLLDATSSSGRTMFTEILQLVNNDWKLGGLYIKPAQVAGHDSEWFLTQARQYKAKGQTQNAWFYFQEGRSLASPLPFMSTLATDKLYDEAHSMQPPDLPAGGKPADLPAGGTTYKLTAVFPEVVGKDLDLIVKYQSADVSNTNQAYQDNIAVIKALTAKYPEIRDAFSAVVARAVDGNGRDYGTLLAMKDIK